MYFLKNNIKAFFIQQRSKPDIQRNLSQYSIFQNNAKLKKKKI